MCWRLSKLSFDCFICCFEEESRKHREDNLAPLNAKKKKRKLLPIVSSKVHDQKLAQMGTLASALIVLGIKYMHVHYKILSTTLVLYSLFTMSMSKQFFFTKSCSQF